MLRVKEWAVYLSSAVVLVLLGVFIHLAGPYYQVGIASWYGPGFDGRRTANGEVYDMHGISAAHQSLPFGTWVRVVDLETGHRVDVRINDRGPFVEGRIIDLSKGAAAALGIVERGITEVGLRILWWPSDGPG